MVEVDLFWRHWKHGNLGAVLGEPATEFLSHCLLVFDNEVNAVSNWRLTPASDGGGGR